ncbi:MAG: stage II sporulation protein R, partial [Acetobacteraceae bacterium]|nr:stage II sporulation protein R [Acetobacteraceae bacterium]
GPGVVRVRRGDLWRTLAGRWGRTLAAVFLAALVLAGAAQYWVARAERAYTSHNLIRLHVVADGDEPQDAALKARVREVVVAALGPLFAGVGDASQARALIEQNLDELKRLVAQEVRRAGLDYPVRLELGRYPFPARRYGTLALPAGSYEALRVVLGRGAGSNWWCVLFPPLCMLELGVVPVLDQAGAWPGGGADAIPVFAPAEGPAADPAPAAAAGSAGQGCLAGGLDGARFEVGFLCLEWLRDLGARFGDWWERASAARTPAPQEAVRGGSPAGGAGSD